MTFSPWLYYALGTAFAGGAGRLWFRFKNDRRARREYAAPLFDPFLLEVALTPRDKDGDDENVLAEIKQTLAHLNRQAYAKEFWSLDKQLSSYYANIPKASRPTMQRALVRLIVAENRWLQIVGAKSSAAIGVLEAIQPLRALLDITNQEQAPADEQFRQELESSLKNLEAKQLSP